MLPAVLITLHSPPANGVGANMDALSVSAEVDDGLSGKRSAVRSAAQASRLIDSSSFSLFVVAR